MINFSKYNFLDHKERHRYQDSKIRETVLAGQILIIFKGRTKFHAHIANIQFLHAHLIQLGNERWLHSNATHILINNLYKSLPETLKIGS